MRLVLSILFTFFGLVAIYLFGSGALADISWDKDGLLDAFEQALVPFMEADLLSTMVLTAGMAFFAFGVLVAPRSDVWVAFSRDPNNPALESRILRYSREISRDKVLEIAIFFNVLVVAAILVLLGMSSFQPSPTKILGALFIAGFLEALFGMGIITFMFLRRRKRPTKKFRPLLAASAGLNILEILFMVGILIFGCLS